MQIKNVQYFPYYFLVLLLSLQTKLSIAANYDGLTLNEAIRIALEQNHRQQISAQSVQISEQLYNEALSARWPSLALNAGFQRRDESPTFVYPSTNVPLGGLDLALSAALGGAPVPSSIQVPEQKIKLFDRNVARASLNAQLPLFSGGKISSVIAQAKLGQSIAMQAAKRTNLEIGKDVKRYYFAAAFTKQMQQTADNTVSLLTTTRDVTKSLYENGSETVNRLDFLKTELAVAYAQGVATEFKNKHQAALTALANTMGLAWDDSITLAQNLNDFSHQQVELDALISQAKLFNPQLGMVKLAVQVADQKIKEAKSGYMPQVGLTADVSTYSNHYDGGLTNDDNRHNWTIGIGVKMSLFDGWRTRSKVSGAKLAYAQSQAQQKLLEQAVATQVKALFIDLSNANDQIAIAQKNQAIADENVTLSADAFAIGATQPEDVIEAHMYHAVVLGALYKARHDALTKLAEIEYVLGSELQ